MDKHWSPESRAAARERMKALHADPEFKAKMKALNAAKKDPWLASLTEGERRWYAKMVRERIPAAERRAAINAARSRAEAA